MRADDLLDGDVAGTARWQRLRDCAQGARKGTAQRIDTDAVDKFANVVVFMLSHRSLLTLPPWTTFRSSCTEVFGTGLSRGTQRRTTSSACASTIERAARRSSSISSGVTPWKNVGESPTTKIDRASSTDIS